MESTNSAALSEHDEISGVAAISLDDARPDVRADAARRTRAWTRRRNLRDVRTRPVFLLPAAHPADSSRRDLRVDHPRRTCRSVALFQLSDDGSSAAARIYVELAAAVSRLRDRRGDPVFPVSLVRRRQSAAS